MDRVLATVLDHSFGTTPLRFCLADGTVLRSPARPPVATVRFFDRTVLAAFVLDPARAFGDAFARGRVTVEGDLVAALEHGYRASDHRPTAWRMGGGDHGIGASRRNARFHYDLGDDFYRLWLDEQLVYTCAYFAEPTATLETAQQAKNELVCRKLGLAPGDRVVEAGCGWGALALHIARTYGGFVKAYNVSARQIAHGRERAWREGLAKRVQFVQDDYRNIRGRFDVFVSVGMIEHVGLENLRALGGVIDRSLAANGRGLLHFIGRADPRPVDSWIRKRMFPGAYVPTLAQVCERVLEPGGFCVRHVENLREHYSRTLACWRERFETAMGAIAESRGESFARTWQLYLAGSEAAFRCGALQLYQVVFERAGSRRPAPPPLEGSTT